MKKRVFASILCLLVLVTLLPVQALATEKITPLKITKQPENGRGQLGERMLTTVEATGDDLTYTWYVRDPRNSEFLVSSIKKNVYSFILKKGNSGRLLYCVITDKYGNSLKTNTVNVSTPVPLKITKQPKNTSGILSSTVKIKITAQGDGLKYRWYIKDPGESSFHKTTDKKATYQWEANKKESGRKVYCIVYDAYGNRIKSNIVTLKCISPLKIEKQPTNAAAAAGSVVKTTVKASGDGLKYQWYYANPNSSKFKKSSINSKTYSTEMTKAKSGRKVYCIITDAYGNKVKTQTVTLKIPKQLKIITQPNDVYTKLGTTGKANVKASGEALTYRWYIKKPDATAFKKSSSTGKSFSLKMTKENLGTQAYCLVTDMYGKKIKTDIITFAVAKAEFNRTLYKIKPKAKRTLELEILPAGTNDEIIWTSSNPKVAKVNAKGVVTGVKNGTVTITARGVNTGFAAFCQVKVCDVKQVAITFDDGPGPYTAELLDFLKENDIRVTFFLVGNRLNTYKNTVKRMAEEGHEIGYHSWKHDIQTKLSNSKIISDFNKSAKILKNIAGAEFTLWRTPGGGRSDRVLNQIPLPHIMWSVDTLDWKYRDSNRTNKVIQNYSKDGSIVLLHDIHKTTVKGAMKALKEMQDGDYEFLSVTELLSRNGKSPKDHKTYFKG